MSAQSEWVSSWASRTINGASREVLTLVRGARTIDAIELDMAEQWDFMEIAGAQIDNEPWVSTALLAVSVIGIDGVPLPSATRSREAIRAVLRRIGAAGLDALGAAFETRAAERDANINAGPGPHRSEIETASGN